MTNFSEAVKMFLSNPLENNKKIIPFIKSKYFLLRRNICERFKIERYSKPYSGHNLLLSEINGTGGVFIVCGGNDGYMSDPTYYLEKFRGWTGIIVEPLPKAAAACRKNRTKSNVYEFALVSDQYSQKMIDLYDCNYMSMTKTSSFDIDDWLKKGETAQNLKTIIRSVPVITLDKLLMDVNFKGKINLLVLDVEGAEEDILRGFSIKKYLPDYILVEIHNESLRSKIENLILPTYKFIKKTDTSDYLYKLCN